MRSYYLYNLSDNYLPQDSNKIRSFGIKAFEKLSYLFTVHLEKNKCINSTFYTKESVLKISKIVEDNCCRPSQHLIADIKAKSLQLDSKNAELLTLRTAVTTLREEKGSSEDAAKLKLSQKNTEISNLKNTLTSSKGEISSLKKTLEELRKEKTTSEQRKSLQLLQKDNENKELDRNLTLTLQELATLRTLHDQEITKLKNTMTTSKSEILSLKRTLEELQRDKTTSDQRNDLQLLQKDTEIKELDRNLTSTLQELAILRILHNQHNLLNETFAELRDQMRIKDRTILESSVKLSVLTQKLAQKEIDFNSLKKKNEMLLAEQENL